MIIWTGHGILIPIFWIAGFILGVTVGGALGAVIGAEKGLPLGFALGGLCGAGLVWLYALTFGKSTEQLLQDPRTGQMVRLVKRNSLFFIPAFAWAVIASVAVLPIGGMGLIAMTAPSPERLELAELAEMADLGLGVSDEEGEEEEGSTSPDAGADADAAESPDAESAGPVAATESAETVPAEKSPAGDGRPEEPSQPTPAEASSGETTAAATESRTQALPTAQRDWKSTDGRVLRASLIGFVGGSGESGEFEREDGERFTIPVERFDAETQGELRALFEAAGRE